MSDASAPRWQWPPSARSQKTRGLRYLLVGATCAGLHNFVMIAADWLGFHYAWATIAAFILVTPFAFWLHSRFTFGAALSWRNLGAFSLGIAAGFPLALTVMAVLCSGLHLAMTLAAPIATVVLFAWNYIAARVAITRRLSGRLPS